MLSRSTLSNQAAWSDNRGNRELAWIAALMWEGQGSKLFVRSINGTLFLTYCKGAE